MKKRVTIFVRYSHRNERWVKAEEEESGDTLIPCLKEQFKGKNVEFWTDHTLREKHVGSIFSKAIDENIQDSDIALLLLSQEFISSEYMCKELPYIKAKFENGGLKIIPVLIEDIADSFKNNWIFDLLIIPDSNEPLIAYKNSEREWIRILTEILNIISNEIIKIRYPESSKKGIDEIFNKANELALYEQRKRNLLGDLYYRGENVPLNKRMAAEFYQKAAEQGNPSAQFALGNMYLFGEGSCIKKNRRKAVEYFTLAAEQGHKKAEIKLNSIQSERKYK
jgi:hypothetical protein